MKRDIATAGAWRPHTESGALLYTMFATLSRHKKLVALGAGGCLLSLPVVGLVEYVDQFAVGLVKYVDQFAACDDDPAHTALGAMIDSDTFIKPPWAPLVPEPEITLRPPSANLLEQGIALALLAWTVATMLWAALSLYKLSLSSVNSTTLAKPKRLDPIHSPAPPLGVVLEESPPSSRATPYATPAASPTSPLTPSACGDADDATQHWPPVRAPSSSAMLTSATASPAGKRALALTTRVHIGFDTVGKGVELSIDIVDGDEAQAGEELEELHSPIVYPATDLMMMR